MFLTFNTSKQYNLLQNMIKHLVIDRCTNWDGTSVYTFWPKAFSKDKRMFNVKLIVKIPKE